MHPGLLSREFFQQDPRDAAVRLIGAELLWHGAAGRIVEVEAYETTGDEASHTFFRPTTRGFVAKYPPGTAYVYLNYGMHWLFNVLVKGPSAEGFVLVRALEPTLGIEEMRLRRGRERSRDLCSGPGKLTQALGITGEAHGTDLCDDIGRGLRLPAERILPERILVDVRIGITKAADFPWRYLLAGSDCLSVRPTKAAHPLSPFSQSKIRNPNPQ